MDISDLISQLSGTHLLEIQDYLLTIIELIKETADAGLNTLLYELYTLDTNTVQKIRNELLTLFPDMEITIREKHLLIDWS